MTAHVVNIHGANGQPVAKVIPLPPARQPGAWAGMTRTVADDVGPDGDIEAEFSESVNQAEMRLLAFKRALPLLCGCC